MSDPNFGNFVTDEDADRDAVHVAVVPLITAVWLTPGTHVGRNKDGFLTDKTNEKLGIVDPFLSPATLRIPPGTRVWLFLYPKTVTGMRHHWKHPAFPDPVPVIAEPPAPSLDPIFKEVADIVGVSVDRLLSDADEHAADGDYIYKGMDEDYKNVPARKWDQFWVAWSELRRRRIPDDGYGGRASNFYSCSC